MKALPAHRPTRLNLGLRPFHNGDEDSIQAGQLPYDNQQENILKLSSPPLQLSKEYMAMQRDPPPFVWAVPDEKNILNCEYTNIITPSIFTHFYLSRAFPRRTSDSQTDQR